MSYEATIGYDVLGAVEGEAVELTDLELNLILGGNEPGVDIREEPNSGGSQSYGQLYQEQQNNPMGNALDLRDHSGSQANPGAMGPMTVGFDQATEVAHDAQDAANTAVYYGRHAVAEVVDVGSEVVAGYAGKWAPVVISGGDRIAEWIRPDGPAPTAHDEKK
jgi:hypothetical protein